MRVIITETTSKSDGRSGMTAHIIVNFVIFVSEPSLEAKIARTIAEATKLLAVGYEYVTNMDNKQIFRKRK